MPKLQKLRRDDACATCGDDLLAGAEGWWDRSAQVVSCVRCCDEATEVAQPRPDRRRPQSTTAKGANGERALANRLSRDLAAPIVVLDDRTVPRTRGNIDHVIIGPNGVWIVDAKNDRGRVERRDVGQWRTTDVQLFVNGRNRMNAVEGMEWQSDAVYAALAGTPFAETPIHSALCFTNSDWPLLAKPGTVRGVWILWAKKLVELASQPGDLDASAIEQIAWLLSGRLPAVVPDSAAG